MWRRSSKHKPEDGVDALVSYLRQLPRRRAGRHALALQHRREPTRTDACWWRRTTGRRRWRTSACRRRSGAGGRWGSPPPWILASRLAAHAEISGRCIEAATLARLRALRPVHPTDGASERPSIVPGWPWPEATWRAHARSAMPGRGCGYQCGGPMATAASRRAASSAASRSSPAAAPARHRQQRQLADSHSDRRSRQGARRVPPRGARRWTTGRRAHIEFRRCGGAGARARPRRPRPPRCLPSSAKSRQPRITCTQARPGRALRRCRRRAMVVQRQRVIVDRSRA